MPSTKRSIKRTLSKIRKNRPTSLLEFKALGLPVRRLGAGLFRAGYKIRGCDLVVKFPLIAGNTEAIEHTAAEMRRIRRLSQSAAIRPYLPTVHYFDKKNGIIVMQYYPKFEDDEHLADALGSMAQRLIRRISHVNCSDIHTGNVRKGSQYTPVIIDFGY
jgi:hypothetical protein